MPNKYYIVVYQDSGVKHYSEKFTSLQQIMDFYIINNECIEEDIQYFNEMGSQYFCNGFLKALGLQVMEYQTGGNQLCVGIGFKCWNYSS